MAQLAGCLSLIADAAPLSDCLGRWSDRFQQELVAALVRRLGVASGDNDRELAAALISALALKSHEIDRIFFDWRGGHDPGAGLYPQEPFRHLAALLTGRELPKSHAYWSDAEPCSMHIEEVEAIWEAISANDDWQPFEEKVRAIRRMGEAMEQDAS